MSHPQDCLSEAMFVASQSYSNSVYEPGAGHVMDVLCDDLSVLIPSGEGDTSDRLLMAA